MTNQITLMINVVIISSYTIISVLGFPTIRWPKIRCLKPIKCVVVLYGKAVVVDRKKISMGCHKMSHVKSLWIIQHIIIYCTLQVILTMN